MQQKGSHVMSGNGRIRSRVRGALMATMLIAACCAALIALRSSSDAQGLRERAPREAFKSGAARSESTLQEIAATLNRIDVRLARLEKTLGEIRDVAVQPTPQPDREQEP